MLIRLLIALLALVAPASAQRLFEIALPAGDVRGFSIDTGTTWTGHSKKYQSIEWRAKGYDGVLFKGAGAGVTHIRPDAMADATILVDRHPGIVRLEGVTVHGGKRQAIFFGLLHMDRPVEAKFRLEMQDSEVVADPPGPGGPRSVWGLFGYQSDVRLKRVKIDWIQGTEHASYWRGFASAAAITWDEVHIVGSGSQGFKIRNSPSECRWVAGARVDLIDCVIENAMQPWNWRGPGCVVAEGPGCDLWLTRCVMKGAHMDRAKLLMVDDAGGDFYSATNGAVGRGYAAGHVVVKDCGFYAGPGSENYTPMVRVAGNGPGASGRYAAKSFTMTGSAAYGDHVQVQLGLIPLKKTRVAGCNTPQIRATAASLGFDASTEAVFTLQHRVAKVSEGLIR